MNKGSGSYQERTCLGIPLVKGQKEGVEIVREKVTIIETEILKRGERIWRKFPSVVIQH
jgi:hypothetical protein